VTPRTAAAPAAALEDLPMTVLQDRLAQILLESGPRKTGELVTAVNHRAVTLKLAKHALKSSSRFTQTSDRRWDLAGRWEAPEYPFEEVLESLVKGAGRPLSAEILGREMARILGRDPDVMAATVMKFATDSSHFTIVGENEFGLSGWLLDTDYDRPEDVIYYNFLDPELIERYRPAASALDWEGDPAAAAVQLVLEGKEPVPFKVAAFFGWEAQRDYFDPAEMLTALWQDEDVAMSSSLVLYRRDRQNELLNALKTLEASLAEELEEEEETEEALPEITDDDIAEMRRAIREKGGVCRVEDLLLQTFELEKGEKAYALTEKTVVERLRHDIEVVWLGAGRFAPPGTVPGHVLEIPQSLIIPVYDFSTPDGERFDLEMEPAGLEASLAKEIHLPIVQDVGDEDPPERPERRPMRADCVLKYHHKQEGTFPLAQLPEGLFAPEPAVQQITIRHDGNAYEAWVNLDTRLVYGLGPLYEALGLPIAGGLFHLNATQEWDVFDLEYSGETDEMTAVAPARLLELLQLKDEADNERLPTFEVMCRLLERQSSGMSYPHLFVEVNLIRRVSRMLVASILSGYPCFTRQPRTGLWVYDPKKKDQGFQKSKRKYVVREY